MKIKLAILEQDVGYLNRIVSVFSTKYTEKFQIYSFTNPQLAISALETEKIDVLIANDVFTVNAEELPQRCSFAYFVDSADVDTVRDQIAICKYQKAELIYKQILSIYSENAGSIAGLKLTEDECKVIVFASPSGGTGTSVCAAACAAHFAALGKKALYLNLSDFGSSDVFFSGEGQATMSDVIFSLKSKKVNLAMKLESYVRQDVATGVFYFASSPLALDMLELKNDEKIQLLSELKMAGSYDYIIIDSDFGLDKNHLVIFAKAHNIVMVGDGSVLSNDKIGRAYTALVTMDQTAEVPLANRFSIIYNKFSNKTGSAVSSIEIKNIGGAPIYSQATIQQIMAQLMAMDMYDKLDM